LSAATPKQPKKPSLALQEARAIIWKHRRRLGVGLVLMILSRLAGLVLPATTKFLIDDVLGKRRVELLMPLALAAAGATIVQVITGFALSQLLGVAAQRQITEMRKRVMVHVSRLPISYFDSTQTGILISRIMNDADGIRNLVGTGLVQLSGGIVTATVALGVLMWLNWKLTLANLIFLALFSWGMTYAFNRLRPLFRERGKIQGEITGRLGETLGGIRIVKAYTAERRERLIFARGAHRLFRNIARTMTGISMFTEGSGLVIGAVGLLLMTIGGHAVLRGEMTLGDFFMYLTFTGMLAAPLMQLAAIGTQISEAFAGLDRIREVMGMKTEVDEDASRAMVRDMRGELEFHDVSFEYNPGVSVLKHVSFRAPAGTTTALVGSSGSGKSTLIGLVMAFHRPLSGQVLVDGRDLAGLKLTAYREHLGVVLQDNFLFDGTVAENIAFSRPGATREEILDVARIAHCDEFVKGFPKGYDTVVGERGVKLSGGQRQRVAIARAIIADPRILILDEATSSLDSESEALIQDGLRSLRHGRTTFVIAHRLSTITSADQILVLEHGEIVERGTHAELLAQGGRYRELYDRQYQMELNRFINPGEDFTPELVVTRRATSESEARTSAI
jgi:subfamily B ATP-binding cassette protein MsbA